jgi:hypothetical protein
MDNSRLFAQLANRHPTWVVLSKRGGEFLSALDDSRERGAFGHEHCPGSFSEYGHDMRSALIS